MRPRSVLVVLHDPDLGGATRAILPALAGLSERGWRVDFWVPGRGRAREQLERAGNEVAGESRPLRYRWSALREPPGVVRRLAATRPYLRRFASRVRALAPALVHANTLLTIPEALVARRAGAATLLHVHETLEAGIRGRVAAALARGAVDAVVCPSRSCREALARRGVASRVIHYSVSSRAVASRPARRPKLVVGTVGTVSRRKGTDLFLAAASTVREHRADVEFRLLGPPAVRGEARWAARTLAAAAEAGVGHRAWAADVPAELADWDVFALASRDDPFPLAVLEAMAGGLAVVGTAVGGIPEQLGRGAGLLVPPDDAEALAAAILRLADDAELRGSLGAAARERVAAEFAPEHQVDALETAYEEAIARAAARATSR